MSARQRRWTQAFACEVVDDLEASGLTRAEFARQRGLHPERLRRWQARLRVETTPTREHLVELVVRDAPAVVRLQVHCPSGHIVEFDEVDLLTGLRAALTAVARVSGC